MIPVAVYGTDSAPDEVYKPGQATTRQTVYDSVAGQTQGECQVALFELRPRAVLEPICSTGEVQLL